MVRYDVEAARCVRYGVSSRLEWLLTNGIGGFAMGTVSGANARRYHGHLVAAVRPPADRVVLLANVEAEVVVRGKTHPISTNQYVGAVHPEGYRLLEGFSVGDFAEWTWGVYDAKIRKRLGMHRGIDAVTIRYDNVGEEPIELTLRPLCSHKGYHGNFSAHEEYPEFLVFEDQRTNLSQDGVELSIAHPGAERTVTSGWFYRFEHSREAERGLAPNDDLFCPCELHYELAPGKSAVLVAATQRDVEPRAFRRGAAAANATLGTRLKDAASHFLVEASSRTSIIAGYPWFTDWGRDTMIALPGVCLVPGKVDVARSMLRDYASQLKHGLIPNRFVEKGETPEYNTVDATLWFCNALRATLEAEWDEPFAIDALGWMRDITRKHLHGTRFGIKVDPKDGLLSQGEEGVQLTWMDAKVGDWVVTPRRGKPVEINGLWINALRSAEWVAGKLGVDASEFVAPAEAAEASFEQAFWNEEKGFYRDTVDPISDKLRPNQCIAMGLPFSPCDKKRSKKALALIRQELVTPYGLRTLGPDEEGYQGRFVGSMRDRDAAYHQGTAWPWLIGPYCSAVLRSGGSKTEVRKLLENAVKWLEEAGLGGIAEVADGDVPQQPGGCPWQAWSVAEALRAWTEAGGK